MMLDNIVNSLRKSGFIISQHKASYATLGGEILEEDRLTATSTSGLVRITISHKSDEQWYRVSILMLGAKATESTASALSRLGGSVDYEPGDRLLAVFKKAGPGDVEEIVNEVLG